MDGGQVRAILWRHATAYGAAAVRARSAPVNDPAVPTGLPDPNDLRPARELGDLLEGKTAEEQRRLAADYVALWARTFRTLVTHIRGRPERALALFADEVYPFLRGDRLAARVESASHRRATLRLAGDLPAPYLCGLVASFVALSGASADAVSPAPGRFDVTYRVASADRLARIAQHAHALRLNLVASAVLAAVLGVALAAPRADVDAMRVVVVLLGTATAQVAGNALHDLRHGHPAGPLAPLRPGRTALTAQLALASTVAAACAAFLALTGTPAVLLFAAAGVGAGWLYAPMRDRGLGPLLTLVLYGPLIAEGALHAFDATAHHVDHLQVLPWTLVPGALAAAALYVDDLADAPLDEAGGKRTLAVRLPRRSQGLAYTALMGVAFAPLAVLLYKARVGPSPVVALPALALAVAGLVLIARVRSSLGVPRRLAPARLGTQAVHAVATLVVALLLAGGVA